MKKTELWMTLIGIVFSLTTVAQQRSEEEAREIAEKYLQSVTGKTTRKQLQKAPGTDRRMASTKTGETAYYIFNDTEESSFVIVSADERMKEILGYCDYNTYVTEQAPEALKWLLDEYATQYKMIQEGTIVKRNSAQKRIPHYLVTGPLPYKNVSALIQTKWGQGNPYNKYCPYVGDKQCITGCLATAMAQVMNFHKYPDIGSGSMTYTSKTNNITLTANFSDPKYYDWNNTLADYVNSYTTAQEDAVANLMNACGIGLGMDYGVDWSGADYSDIPYPLHTFFGYSRNVAYISRDYFKTEEWTEIITNELLNGRPVIYNGNDDEEGGHSFVLDGVWDKERFHINWGWYGYCNGFYALDALTPESETDYAFYQNAIINISPTDVGIHQDVYYAADFEVSESQVTSDQKFTATLHNVWNYSNSASSKIESTTFNGYMGIAIYSMDMELIDVLTSRHVNNKMYWGWQEIGFDIRLNKNKFPENDSCYVVPVIINSENEITPIRTMHAESDAVLAINKNSVITLKTLREVETTEFEEKGLVYTWIPNKKGCVAVKGCTSVPSNGTVTVPSVVTFSGDVYAVSVIGDSAFINNENVKVLELPGSIDSIGNGALANMTALTTLKMNRTVPPLVADDSAFYGITDVKLLVPADCRDAYMQDETWKVFTNIEEEPLEITDFTYDGIQYTQDPNKANCVMVKTNKSADVSGDIVIPEEVPYKEKLLKVTALAEKAFYRCENVTYIELPATIDSISRYALAYMKGLKSIKVKANNPPKVPNKAVFSSTTNVPLTVPFGCSEAYKGHSYWSAFTTIMEDEGNIDAIGSIKEERILEGKAYDLSGKKLNSSAKGHQRQIIVKGGKKYVAAFGR